MKQTIKLITFDLDDTLWPVEEIILKAEAALQYWITENFPIISDNFSRDEILRIRKFIIKEKPEISHNLTQLRILILKEIFFKAGYTEEEAQKHSEKAFTIFIKARNTINFFPGALTLLETLSKDYMLIGLSNGNADLNMIGIGHLFCHHHSAESIGKPKPHPDMFEAALASASLQSAQTIDPQQTVHIGDHPQQDVEAARVLGIKTIWVNVLNRQWPKELEKTAEANHLKDIPTIIKGL